MSGNIKETGIEEMIRMEEKETAQLLKHIKIFPGDITHYAISRGYPAEKIDTGEQDEGIILNPTEYGYEILGKNIREVKELINNGFEAIVDAKPVITSLDGDIRNNGIIHASPFSSLYVELKLG